MSWFVDISVRSAHTTTVAVLSNHSTFAMFKMAKNYFKFSRHVATAQDVARVSCRRFRTRIPFTFLGGGGGGGIDGPRDGYPWPFPPSSSQDPTERASGRERRSVLASAAQPIHRFLHCSFHVVIVTVRDSFTGWNGRERGAIEFLYRTVLLRLSCSCRWQNPTPIGIGLLSLPLMRLR